MCPEPAGISLDFFFPPPILSSRLPPVPAAPTRPSRTPRVLRAPRVLVHVLYHFGPSHFMLIKVTFHPESDFPCLVQSLILGSESHFQKPASGSDFIPDKVTFNKTHLLKKVTLYNFRSYKSDFGQHTYKIVTNIMWQWLYEGKVTLL